MQRPLRTNEMENSQEHVKRTSSTVRDTASRCCGQAVALQMWTRKRVGEVNLSSKHNQNRRAGEGKKGQVGTRMGVVCFVVLGFLRLGHRTRGRHLHATHQQSKLSSQHRMSSSAGIRRAMVAAETSFEVT